VFRRKNQEENGKIFEQEIKGTAMRSPVMNLDSPAFYVRQQP